MKNTTIIVALVVFLLVAGVIVLGVVYAEENRKAVENEKVIEFMKQQAESNEKLGSLIIKESNDLSSPPTIPIYISPPLSNTPDKLIYNETKDEITAQFSPRNRPQRSQSDQVKKSKKPLDPIRVDEFDAIVKRRIQQTPELGFRRIMSNLLSKRKSIVEKEQKERLFEHVCVSAKYLDDFKTWFPGEDVSGLKNEKRDKFMPWVEFSMMLRKIIKEHKNPSKPFLFIIDDPNMTKKIWMKRRNELKMLNNHRYDILTRYLDRSKPMQSEHDLWFIIHPDIVSPLYYQILSYFTKRSSKDLMNSKKMNLNFLSNSFTNVTDITTEMVSYSRSKGKKIGILFIATGKYHRFLGNTKEAFEKYFCRRHRLHFFVWTDQEVKREPNITVFKIPCSGFPMDTLLRYEFFKSQKRILQKQDILVYCDVDFTITNNNGFPDPNLFAPERKTPYLIALVHLYKLKNSRFGPNDNLVGTPEDNPMSLAYIDGNKHHMKNYYAGGIQGGDALSFLTVCDTLSERIRTDLNDGIIAKHNDESHWNWYLNCKNQIPLIELPVSYIFPERCLPSYENYKFHKDEYECAKLKQLNIKPLMVPLEKNSSFHSNTEEPKK